jgi:N-methylhydantoinase A
MEAARRGTRQVWFAGGSHETQVWSRLDLPVGAAVAGPALRAQPDATTVVEPGLSARVDSLGNIVIERAA